MAARKPAKVKLQKELKSFLSSPPPFVPAVHVNESNILEWHCLIQGPPDSPYAGGWYVGRLRFPPDYPFSPPAICVLTPSGRFEPGVRLCFSMSDYHPETWNPMWSVAAVCTGLLSFMLSDELTTGGLKTTDEEKRRLAARSVESIRASGALRAMFPQLEELVEAAEQGAGAGGEGEEGEASGPERTSEGALEAGDPEEAVRLAGEVLAAGEVVGEALERLQSVRARALGALCQLDEAAAAARLAGLEPEAGALERCKACRAEGNRAFKRGDLVAARDAYERGLEAVPHCATLHCSLAAVLEREGDPVGAAAACRAALAIQASHHKARRRLADCLAAGGQHAAAAEEYARLVDVDSAGEAAAMRAAAEEQRRLAGA